MIRSEEQLSEEDLARVRSWNGYEKMKAAGYSDAEIFRTMNNPYMAGSWTREGPW